MAEYNIDQFIYGGNTYKFVDNTVNTGKVKTVSLSSTAPLNITAGTGDSATTINKTIALSNAIVNTVLVGPGSGSTVSAPSYRKLVNADIPAALTGKNIQLIYTAAASAKGVDTGITSSTLTSVNLPTTKAVVDYIGTNPGGYTNNTGTVTSVATGVGLTGGTITGTGTIKAKLKSETVATYDSTTITNTSGRQYAVVQDKSGYLSVNVPWEAGSGSGSGTDEKVTQTNTTIGGSLYRLLFSANANDTTETTTARKSGKLLFDPTGTLTLNGSTITSDKITSWDNTTSAVNVIGTVLSGNGTKSNAASSSTTQNLTNFSLTTGTWIITANIHFGSDATGYRLLDISPSSTSDLTNWISFDLTTFVRANTGSTTILQVASPVIVSGTSCSFAFNERQNSGNQLNIDWAWKAIRIK